MVTLGQTKTDVRQYVTVNDAFSDIPSGGRVVIPNQQAEVVTVVVPAGKSLWCEGEGQIVSNHAGVCIEIEDFQPMDHRIAAIRPAAGGQYPWDGTSETTSVGCSIVEAQYQSIYFGGLKGFAKGIVVGNTPSVIGVTDSHFYLGQILDNKVGITIGAQVGSGASTFGNALKFYGGRVSLTTTSPDQEAGTAYIDIVQGNGNKFIGVDLEGSRGIRSVIFRQASFNKLMDCRWETSPPIEFAPDVSQPDGCRTNAVVDGYNLWGEYDTGSHADNLEIVGIDPDDPDHAVWMNRIMGPGGLMAFSSTLGNPGAAIEVRSTQVPAEAEYRARGRTGNVYFDMSHDAATNDRAQLKLMDAGGTLRTITLSAAGVIEVDGTPI